MIGTTLYVLGERNDMEMVRVNAFLSITEEMIENFPLRDGSILPLVSVNVSPDLLPVRPKHPVAHTFPGDPYMASARVHDTLLGKPIIRVRNNRGRSKELPFYVSFPR
jgi:hypothetical protein